MIDIIRQLEKKREQARHGGGNQRGGGAQNELDKPEAHSGGKFVADGLQEGVYEVHIQATDFARYQSAEIEVRQGIRRALLEGAFKGCARLLVFVMFQELIPRGKCLGARITGGHSQCRAIREFQ